MSKVILSKHALDRAKFRKMEIGAIEEVVLHPQKEIDLGEGKIKFIKRIAKRNYQVIATHLNKENKWLVISVWVKGEEDRIPLIWQLLTLPFRLLWLLLKTTWQIVAKIAGKN